MADATLVAFSIVLGAFGVFIVLLAFAFQNVAGLIIALAIFVISIISLVFAFRKGTPRKEKTPPTPIKVEAPVRVKPKAPAPAPIKVETQFKVKPPTSVGTSVKVQPKVATNPAKGKPKPVKPTKTKLLPPNTVYCPYCGKQIPKDSLFCPNCGSSIE
jgi:hypothetical protein